MNNEITLIIPDLHHRVDQAEKIIKSVGADKIIFTGDYFDDFDDTPDNVRHTSEWLNWSVNQPNRLHLFGNHDQQYAFAFRSFICSGYADWKERIIQDMVPVETWDKVKWYTFLDNTWLLSHGGLHNSYLPEYIKKLSPNRPFFYSKLSEYLNKNIKKGLSTGGNNWIFRAGASRGGSQSYGGITWCDYEREFLPIQGLNQIVGHTPQVLGIPKWCNLNNKGETYYYFYDRVKIPIESINNTNLSINFDLDVHRNTHWGLWNGKSLEIGKYSDL